MQIAPESVTFDVGGAQITVDTHALFQAWLSKALVAPVSTAESPPLPFFPAMKEGEQYAGIILGKDGAASYHLMLQGEAENIKWDAAKEWAAKAGGDLPTRREQALLYANLKEQFKPQWYWSSEQYAAGTGYAWLQNFNDGNQVGNYKSYEYRARAVRRVPII